jgi:ABC-type phosphate transport system substrate-binding protein
MKIISLLSALLFTLFLFVSGYATLAQTVQSTTGKIIYTEYGSLVIKTGYKETEFTYDPDVEIILSEKAKELEGLQTIEICQIVRVTYVLEDKVKRAVKIEIITPSDCYK